jgi:hypothetical protein
MSSEGGVSLLVEIAEVVMDSWASYAALHKFAWVVERCGLSSSALQAVLARASLSLWLSKLEIRVGGEGSSSGAPSADDEISDSLVLSVESGWTPRGVLLWLFFELGGLLFGMIAGEDSPM